MGKKHPWYNSYWTVTHVRDGEVIWQDYKRNALVDEGEENMLETYYCDQDAPSQFYLRLCRDSLREIDTLLDVQNEPTLYGYAPQMIERSTVGFPTKELHEGDYRLTTKQVTYAASGGAIGPVNCAYLSTTSDNSGKLIAFVSLSMERTILDGDSLYAQISIKLK